MSIEKSLPNVRTTVKTPSKADEMKELQETLSQQSQDPIEITRTEDGGAEINFDPRAVVGQGGQNHEENLAEFLDDAILKEVGSQVVESYSDYKSSRSDWEDTYIKGLDLLGFKYENRSEPFQGASGATHPVLAEAVTQFQALAYKELLPASGPVRTQIIGKVNQAKEDQADRVKEFMNYQLMVEMKEYEPEFDQMLFNLPLSGSTFKKIYFDSLLNRCVSKYVPAEDLYVPYAATSLDDAESIIHSIKMTGNDILKYQLSGFYKDVDIVDTVYSPSDVEEKKDNISGKSTSHDEIYTLLEAHCDLDLDGFNDIGMDGEQTGLKLPYIVTVDEGTGTVLAIRRNFNAQDPSKKRRD